MPRVRDIVEWKGGRGRVQRICDWRDAFVVRREGDDDTPWVMDGIAFASMDGRVVGHADDWVPGDEAYHDGRVTVCGKTGDDGIVIRVEEGPAKGYCTVVRARELSERRVVIRETYTTAPAAAAARSTPTWLSRDVGPGKRADGDLQGKRMSAVVQKQIDEVFHRAIQTPPGAPLSETRSFSEKDLDDALRRVQGASADMNLTTCDRCGGRGPVNDLNGVLVCATCGGYKVNDVVEYKHHSGETRVGTITRIGDRAVMIQPEKGEPNAVSRDLIVRKFERAAIQTTVGAKCDCGAGAVRDSTHADWCSTRRGS